MCKTVASFESNIFSSCRKWDTNIQQILSAKNAALERAKTRYQIVDTVEQEDGSIVVHVRKQYNDQADVSEYFE